MSYNPHHAPRASVFRPLLFTPPPAASLGGLPLQQTLRNNTNASGPRLSSSHATNAAKPPAQAAADSAASHLLGMPLPCPPPASLPPDVLQRMYSLLHGSWPPCGLSDLGSSHLHGQPPSHARVEAILYASMTPPSLRHRPRPSSSSSVVAARTAAHVPNGCCSSCWSDGWEIGSDWPTCATLLSTARTSASRAAQAETAGHEPAGCRPQTTETDHAERVWYACAGPTAAGD
ncbi:hypothetical protein BC831DRAFT_165622 [Entophlyctis helioformis]|nr:hypothetical protein BC831DRAFT_165622 [Entophlyctis helioformis]